MVIQLEAPNLASLYSRVQRSEIDGSSVGLASVLDRVLEMTMSSLGDISVVTDDPSWITARASTIGSLGTRIPTNIGLMESVLHNEVLALEGPICISDIQSMNCFKNLTRYLEWNELVNQQWLDKLDTIGPVLACPISVGNRKVGVVFLARTANCSNYSQKEVRMVQQSANQAAEVILNEDRFAYLRAVEKNNSRLVCPTKEGLARSQMSPFAPQKCVSDAHFR